MKYTYTYDSLYSECGDGCCSFYDDLYTLKDSDGGTVGEYSNKDDMIEALLSLNNIELLEIYNLG